MADLQKIADELSKLTVLEAVDLAKKLKEMWSSPPASSVLLEKRARSQRAAPARRRALRILRPLCGPRIRRIQSGSERLAGAAAGRRPERVDIPHEVRGRSPGRRSLSYRSTPTLSDRNARRSRTRKSPKQRSTRTI